MGMASKELDSALAKVSQGNQSARNALSAAVQNFDPSTSLTVLRRLEMFGISGTNVLISQARGELQATAKSIAAALRH
jgi:hypothetical protein